MGIIGKVGGIVGTVSALGGGVGLSIHLLSKYPTVSTKLISEGFELASTESDWTTLSTAHNLLKQPNDKVFKEEGATNKDWKWLKDKCEKALSSKESDQTNYELARQWCVKETDIVAILGKPENKQKVLDSKQTTDDDTHWPKKLATLKLNNLAIKALDIQKNNNEAIVIGDLKTKCETIIKTKTTARDFNAKFALAKEWCSIPTTDPAATS